MIQRIDTAMSGERTNTGAEPLFTDLLQATGFCSGRCKRDLPRPSMTRQGVVAPRIRIGGR